MTPSSDLRNRLAILLLGAGFLAILIASLIQRFHKPELTVNRFADSAHGNARIDDGNMGGIGKLMREAAERPSDQDVLLRLVEGLMAAGEWQSAENFAQKALSLDNPDAQNPRGLYLLALIHHNQERNEQAAELLEKMLEKTENASARYSLGILYLHFLQQKEKGLEQLQKGLLCPDLTHGLQEAINAELEKVTGNSSGHNDYGSGLEKREYGKAANEGLERSQVENDNAGNAGMP